MKLDRMTLLIMSALQLVTWGWVRRSIQHHTLRLYLEVQRELKGKFYA